MFFLFGPSFFVSPTKALGRYSLAYRTVRAASLPQCSECTPPHDIQSVQSKYTIAPRHTRTDGWTDGRRVGRTDARTYSSSIASSRLQSKGAAALKPISAPKNRGISLRRILLPFPAPQIPASFTTFSGVFYYFSGAATGEKRRRVIGFA